jgi:hypothetical protein
MEYAVDLSHQVLAEFRRASIAPDETSAIRAEQDE